MKDQIQFETNGVTVLSVKVPEGTDLSSIIVTDWNALSFYTGVSPNHCTEEIKLPEGDWSIHAVTPEITEEQAKLLVEYDNDKRLFKCYELKGNLFLFYYALTSISGLLRSHGIDPKQKNVLLINRKK